MKNQEAFRPVTFRDAGQVIMPHKYPMHAELRHVSPSVALDVIQHVIGRNVRENGKGVSVSYRCRQIRGGHILRDTVEFDESELVPLEQEDK